MPADGAATATATTATSASDDRPSSNFASLRNRRFPQSPDSSSPAPSMSRRDSSLRANSFRTDSSSVEGRPRSFSLKTSTEDLLSPRATGEHNEHQVEASLWYSVPLLLAIVPAVASIAFKGGSVFVTDLFLLLLTAIYLNWFLITPWTWYQSARSISLVKGPSLDVAVEDPIEEEKEDESSTSPTAKPVDGSSKTQATALPNKEVKDAVNELHLHEASALALCFVGPIIGAYLLHVIRGSLSDIGHQMISNLHLTLFALGAEIRPMRHAIKLIHARTIFLQRIVRENPQMSDKMDNTEALQNLGLRLDELETSVADMPLSAPPPPSTYIAADNTEQVKKIQNTLQTQIDALNRAVRRYEKRATAQTMQTEARLQDLETRLRDALSLAAIAANYSQKPGIVSVALDVSSRLILFPLRALKSACMYPLLVLNNGTVRIMVLAGLATDERYGSTGKSAYYGKSAEGVRDNFSSRKVKY